MIAILIDGDACPVKDEVYSVSTRHGLPVVLVANMRLHVPDGMGIEMVVVDKGPDAADYWIAHNVQPGDIVVTADLPLAARCLEVSVCAVDQKTNQDLVSRTLKVLQPLLLHPTFMTN